MINKSICLYTDGACSGNPGPGGWAAILTFEDKEKILSGGEEETTNNRMELIAVIEGLKAVKYPCNIKLYSDSSYVINGLSKGWAEGWKKNGWRKSDKSPALNPDLWDTLLQLVSQHNMEYVWVRGHNGFYYNEKCDQLATAKRDEFADIIQKKIPNNV